MEPGSAILLSAVLATLGWLYNGRVQRLTSRRHHTYQIITRLEDEAKLQSAALVLRRVLNSGQTPRLGDPLGEDNIELIDFILNRYEFLATSIFCGDVDEQFVKRTERSRILRMWKVLLPYIEENRERYGQPSMWENLESIVGRWEAGSTLGGCCRSYEWVILRPCSTHPKPIRRADAIIAKALKIPPTGG